MNIVRENRENQLAIVKVTVAEPDYIEEVNKKLHEYKRKANMPGFRPGMVPMSIINKLYRKGAIAEAAYKAASDACFKYIEDEKIDYMGDVMPSDEQGGFDFDNNTEHEFVFELGLAPGVNVELSADDKITRYKIKADDDMRDSFRQNFLNRFGMMKDVESIEKDEALTVTLDNGEMKVEEAYVGLVSMTDEQKAPFIGKKKGDTYMKTWETIPPKRPAYFYAYLAKICRFFALGKLDWKAAAKRKAEVVSLTDEMALCIPDQRKEAEVNAKEIGRAMNAFLENLSQESRVIFLRRYWFCDTIAEIAERYGISESKVKMRLHRTRTQLADYLNKEGIMV